MRFRKDVGSTLLHWTLARGAFSEILAATIGVAGATIPEDAHCIGTEACGNWWLERIDWEKSP